MSSEPKDGGTAFPGWTNNHYTDQRPVGGMTLRDYFAAKALQGMLANPGNESSGSWQDADQLRAAIQAFSYADSMLLARSNTGT